MTSKITTMPNHIERIAVIMKPSLLVLASAVMIVLALITAFLWRSAPAPGAVVDSRAPASAEQALVDQLVLMNRMLASKEMGILAPYGHVSVRSRANADRYYISSAVSPFLVTARDIYESDLDNNPVAGNRSDLLQERFIHGEIYKARPDVMAVVYTSAPELVAFSVSSVALPRNNGPVPVFDIRKVEAGQSGHIDTPALGRALAKFLGKETTTLMLGQGAVVASPTTNALVSGVLGLRLGARQKMFEISLGGTLNHMVFTREKAIPEAGGAGNTGPSGNVERIDRFAAFFNFMGARDLARTPGANRAGAQRDPNSDQSVIEDLVIANRLLASAEIGVLTPDGLAHVSARSRTHPDHFFIAHDVSPGMVSPADIIENDLDTTPVKGGKVAQYSERFIHSEIYRTRPDVMAVLHAHTPELRTFGQSSVKLRPVFNGALFIGDGLPIFDITRFTGGAPSPISCVACISTPQLGRALATVMGNRDASLLLDHGIALGAPSVRALVTRAYNLKLNATIQQMAISLGGTVNSLDQSQGTVSTEPQHYPEWDYWKQIVLGSMDLNAIPQPAYGLPITGRQ
jgi:ribulose-5-phosphate 4-epimerase/fuculose-1-phosphate aldolase